MKVVMWSFCFREVLLHTHMTRWCLPCYCVCAVFMWSEKCKNICQCSTNSAVTGCKTHNWTANRPCCLCWVHPSGSCWISSSHKAKAKITGHTPCMLTLTPRGNSGPIYCMQYTMFSRSLRLNILNMSYPYKTTRHKNAAVHTPGQ